MQRIRDCSVFSLQGNEYASFPFSKLRDHCRRGCQMSVRTRSSRWSQANIMFLSQQDSPTYELTAVGEHLQDLCKPKPAKIPPWRGELRTSQMGWEGFHPSPWSSVSVLTLNVGSNICYPNPALQVRNDSTLL